MTPRAPLHAMLGYLGGEIRQMKARADDGAPLEPDEIIVLPRVTILTISPDCTHFTRPYRRTIDVQG